MSRILKKGGTYNDEVIKELVLSELSKQDFGSVKELVVIMQQTLGIPEAVLIRVISLLENEGKIELLSTDANHEHLPYSERLMKNLPSLLKKYDYILVSIVLVVFGVILVIPPPLEGIVFPLRIITGGTLTLFLPGYALYKALFPSSKLTTLENMVIYFGSSFVISSLVIFILATLGLIISEVNVFLAISIVTFISLIVGVYRSRVMNA